MAILPKYSPPPTITLFPKVRIEKKKPSKRCFAENCNSYNTSVGNDKCFMNNPDLRRKKRNLSL